MAKGATSVAKPDRPYLGFMKELHDQAELESSLGGQNAFDIASQVVDKITEATTLDGIFDANDSGIDKAKDYANIPLTLMELGFSKSSEAFAKNNLGVFVVVDAVKDDGEEVRFSVGATNVVASFYQMQRLGLMGATPKPRIKIATSETPNGTLYKIARP